MVQYPIHFIPSECLALGRITFLYLCVQVPITDLLSRYGHCAAAFTLSPGIAEVVLFGGCTTCPPKIETFIAETTVLRFGKYIVCMIWLIKALV